MGCGEGTHVHHPREAHAPALLHWQLRTPRGRQGAAPAGGGATGGGGGAGAASP